MPSNTRRRRYEMRDQKRDQDQQRERERKCGTVDNPKTQYESEKLARDAADAYAKLLGHHISHYRCEYCGHFHVGHTPSPRRRKT